MKATKDQLYTAAQLAQALYESIKNAGPTGISSGLLYAACISHVDLEAYTGAVRLLKDLNLVTEKNYLLTAT